MVKRLLVLVLALASLLFATSAYATDISTCGQDIATSGTYFLTGPLSCANDFVTISGDYITLDCQGYTVDGPGVGVFGNIGIQITGNYNTVKNCDVTDFGAGMYILDGEYNEVYDNFFQYNGKGIYIQDGSYNNIHDNNACYNPTEPGEWGTPGLDIGVYSSNEGDATGNYGSNVCDGVDNEYIPASGNSITCPTTCDIEWSGCDSIDQPGIYVLPDDISAESNCIVINSDDVVLDGNNYRLSPFIVTAYERPNLAGIYIDGRDNVEVKNFNIDGFLYGIYAYNSNDITITSNDVTDNTYGIFFDALSDGITVTSNTANDNGYGIVGAYSSDSEVSYNTANSNDNYGIYIHGCTGMTMTGNAANDNTKEGIRISSPSEENGIPNYDIYGDGTLGMSTYEILITHILPRGGPYGPSARLSAFDFIKSIYGGVPPFEYGIRCPGCYDSSWKYNADPKKAYVEFYCDNLGQQPIELRINDSTLTPPEQYNQIAVTIQDNTGVCDGP